MFRTKKDVDRHVDDVFRKVKSEHERNLRCYNIAQQYFKVRDFEKAKHFLSLYLSVKEDSPLAHKLQGQIWEGLGDKVHALNAYKTSLEYEANQPELVLKMCELLCDTDVAMDIDRAHYWCERAANLFPHDPAVFRLKEKLLSLSGNVNTHAFEELINSEVRARPNDVNVRTRLMRLYLETRRTKAAFNHAMELEANQTFRKELAWYECFAEVCKAYAAEFPSQVDWQLFCTWLTVLDRVASLVMSELAVPKKLADCVQAVFSMDQVLYKAANTTATEEHSELYEHFKKHMSAQLCFHIATLILKRAKKEPSNWREAKRSISIILFLALSPPPDIKAPWTLALRLNFKQSLMQWTNDAYYRVSQAGYILLALAKVEGNQFTEKVTTYASENWRERTFQRIFTVLDHRASISTSHFVQSQQLAKVSVRLPVHDLGFLRTSLLVPVYEKVRDTLHHLVWLGVETAKHNDNKIPPDFHTYSFTKLKLTTSNLSNVSPDTLSILDVDAFLYAAVLCAAATLEQEVLSEFYSSDRPVTIPADISNLRCTQEQMSWWTSACQVNSQLFNINTNPIVLRQQLQRGLEVVRVGGNHGLDVMLIVKLACTFADRAKSVPKKSGEQTALEDRATLYWNAALPLLERIEKNQIVHTSNTKLFEYPRKELSMAEVSSLLEEGRYFVACQFMKAEQFERAIEAFKPLRSPYASFNQALIHKKLAAAELEQRPREEITSEMRSKHVILLSKAREWLNVTWERIRIDRRHPLHNTLPEHIAEVDRALSCIEPDPDMDRNLLGTARSLDFSLQRLGLSFHSSNLNRSNEEANISEVSVSSVGSPGGGDAGMQPQSTPRVNVRVHRQTSTPRRTYSENKHHNNNGELVNIGELLQIQTLHDAMKKMQDMLEVILDYMNELRRDMNKLKPAAADDLYMFDEEEYPEDVLASQYPPTFVPTYSAVPQPTPTFYPQPPRGVQGTSTVTYGAPPPTQPPVIPLIPMRMPLDPALAAYQTPQNLAFFNQGTLPFPEHPLPDFLKPSIPKPVIPQQVPPPPVNVVITTSDTLPTGPPPVQPMLSVTIPPQHRLGTLPSSTPPASTSVSTSTPPHKFQIAMPPTATILSLQKSPISVPEEVDSEEENEVGYDPCPDFRPVVPLPNEVSVTTGEEDDEILFENRAKLFRFVEKEWKERGVGVVKILKNRMTGKVRLLMRRDQVHKVCANHLLKSDMELTMLKNSDRALVWVANDFAEEVVQLEKFCIKFKTTEEAMKFKNEFNDAKSKCGQSPVKNPTEKELSQPGGTDASGKVNLGGFTFISPPKLKELVSEKDKSKEENKKESQSAPSPFAAFSFTPQKPGASVPFVKANSSVNLSESSAPLFAGLNSTQNKHTLFNDVKEDTPQHAINLQASSFKVPNETKPKTILKEPVLTSVPVFSSTKSPIIDKQTVNAQVKIESLTPQAKGPFNFVPQAKPPPNSPKETPKSILKDSPANSPVTPPVSTAKATPAAKHVLFQDSPSVSLSEQTPTLAALLKTPQTPVMDFATLSKINANKTAPFGSELKSGGFEGAGTAVFSSSRVRKESEGENAEEFVPSVEFKPVIPLPELVEVKTGEEGQEVLFNERAKLMRFDSETKEWKERGLGQMKILKDPTTGVTRFLMRREQVLKVCCNHRIIQSLELKPSSSSEKAWTWYAVDYSEGETKNELFAIRFKTVELSKAFKATVDKVQKQMREESTSKRSCPDSGSQEEESSSSSNVWKCQFCLFPNSADSRSCKSCSKSKSEPNLPKLSELFRPKTGSWECKACYTINGMKDSTCISCDSAKEKPKSPGPVTPPIVQGPSLKDMFKPKPGSWECGTCLVRNDGDKTACSACATARPGYETGGKESPKSSFSFSNSGSFSFGIKPSDDKVSGFDFGIKPSGKTPKVLFTPGVKSSNKTLEDMPICIGALDVDPKPNDDKGSGFTFGMNLPEVNLRGPYTFGVKPTEPVPKPAEIAPSQTGQLAVNAISDIKESKSVTVATTGFVFGSSKTVTPFSFAPKTDIVASSADSTTSLASSKFGNVFGDTSTPSKASFMFGAPSATNSTVEENGEKFAFGKDVKFEFNFSGVKPQPQRSPRSPGTTQETDSEPEEVDEEEADHIVFQPVVPLPDKVPVTTGEEDETVLYSHRAKLYRFSQGEWKERGVGDIKILRHNVTNKIRFLMRREPILKICLNHFLSAELTVTPKDDRSWLWSAPDFADGELRNEQFCLRLKTPEIASEFKAAVDSAQGEVQAAKCEPLVNREPVDAESAANDLEIVYEARVSDELREAALKLQLPPNFYSYLQAPVCPGCAGCEPDSEGEEITSPMHSELTTTVPAVSKMATTSSATVTTTSISQPFIFTVKRTTPSTTSSSVLNADATSTATTQSVSSTESSALGSTANVTSVWQSQHTNSLFSGSPIFQNPSIAKPPSGSAIGSNNMGGLCVTQSGQQLLFGTTPSTQSATTLSFGGTQNPPLTGGIVVGQKNMDTFHFTTLGTTLPSTFGNSSQLPASVFGTPTSQESSKVMPFFGNFTSFQSPQNSVFGGGNPQSPASTIRSPAVSGGGSHQSPASAIGSPSVFGGGSNQSSASAVGSPSMFVVPQTSSIQPWSPFFGGTPPSTLPSFSAGGFTTQPVTSAFGGNSQIPSTQTSLIGSSPQMPTVSSFGSALQISSQPTLSEGTSQTQTTSAFGGVPQTPTTFSFGGVLQTSTTSIFGGTSQKHSTHSSLIGSSSQTSSTSELGGTSQTSTSEKLTVGTPTSPAVGDVSSQTDSNSGPTFLFKPTTSFSDIAAISKQSQFGSGKGNSSFTWEGAGTTLFGKTLKASPAQKSDDGEDTEEVDGDTSHDPVFEPIVPLPDTIELRTGEEDEEIEFCNRAKFYRYDSDTKEWKERGTGDMKILRHRETQSYRLLLRREQVHKVVCNQLIMAETELQNLATSDKSYCWAGMNMAEEYTEPLLEKVAVRFKNADIANEFKAKVDESVAAVKEKKEREKSQEMPALTLEPVITIEEVGTDGSEGDGEEGEYCEGEYVEGEESEPMFEKRATLHTRKQGQDWKKDGQGALCIVYSQDSNMGNIVFKRDSGEHITISPKPESYLLAVSDKIVAWSGYGYDSDDSQPEVQEYKAVFCTPQAANEFLDTFSEVLELSRTFFDSSYVDSEAED